MALYTSGRARRSLIDTITFRILSQIATVLGYVVLVRGMTKEDFGAFNLLYSFIPVVSTVASLGLEQTLRRYQPEFLSQGNAAAAAWLVRFVASARFGANVALLTLIVLSWNQVAPIFKLAPYRAEFLVLCLLLLLHFQARILELALAGHMLQRFSVGATAVIAIAKLLGYGLLIAGDNLTIIKALGTDIVAYGLAYTGLVVAYRRYCVPSDSRATYRPDRNERRRLLRYGMYNNFNDAGTLFLDSKTDNFFIAAILDTASVGIYAFYTRLNAMLQNILPARFFQSVVQPLFFAIPAAEAERKVPQYFSLLVNLNMLWQMPVLTYAGVYHGEIVEVVFGGQFLEHSWMLPLILALATCNVFEWPVTLVAQYQEKAATMLFSKLFALYNIAALVFLIPTFGVAGAAIASGSAQIMKYAFIWWRVRRLARWTNAIVALVTCVVVWGAVAIACQVAKRILPDVALLQLGLGSVAVAVGMIVHLRGPGLSAADRRILATLLAGKESKALRWIGLLQRRHESDARGRAG
jgi:O-antigen/teichoic acid export membrane protein